MDATRHSGLHPNSDQPGCPDCRTGVFQISMRRNVEVAGPDDVGLVTPSGSLTKFGSHAACFLDAEIAESVALKMRKSNPGWGTRVVGVAGFRRPKVNGKCEPKAKRTIGGVS